MYFDAVVGEDIQPIFNGTPEEVTAWLQENPSEEKRWVCIGKSMRIITVAEYVKQT